MTRLLSHTCEYTKCLTSDLAPESSVPSLLHQVNLLSRLPLRCHPQPSPPQLWPILPNLNQAAPRSRTVRCHPPLVQSGWLGSGRRVLSIRPSSPPATRHLLVREASGHLGLAVLQVGANSAFLGIRLMPGAVTSVCLSINIANSPSMSWYRGHVRLVPAPDEQPHDASSAAGRAVGLLSAPAHGAG